MLKRNCKALCFSQDYRGKWGCASSAMWAHYGGNHTGVCLELDKEEFERENPNIDWKYFRKIKYVEYKIPHRQVGEQRNPFDHKKIDFIRANKIGLKNYVLNEFKLENLNYFYFTKNKEWQYERETRLVIFGDQKKKVYCCIKNSLKNIHLGVKFNDKHLPSLKALVNGVNINKMKYGDISLYSEELA
ncbi:DUF2971 domain-containing protein [Aurantibacillus circumpalustris]|uniref:DUF2971 domain-containing protein n=1 Tax=Aurantibacillus circumpalustris TaxID=3036359 RepID=UPI00295B6A62|nr:DUF2971 domain-containing protein [Aurantibacillus circumpalustris]